MQGNDQNLIVEGCYIPFDWKDSFDEEYLKHIRYICLAMSEKYIRNHFADILEKGSVIELRLDDSDCEAERLIEENRKNLELCRKYGCEYVLIDEVNEVRLPWDNEFTDEQSNGHVC